MITLINWVITASKKQDKKENTQIQKNLNFTNLQHDLLLPPNSNKLIPSKITATYNYKYSEEQNIKIEWQQPQGGHHNLCGQEKRLIRNLT